MSVIYFVQSGQDGPVKIGLCADGSFQQRLRTMQAGNPEPLLVRALYAGDRADQLQEQLRHRDRRLGDDWFAPNVLLNLPDLTPVPFDDNAQRRALAARNLAELARTA